MRTLSLEENGGERTVAGMEDRDDTVTDNCSDAPVVRDLMIVDPAGYDVARQRCLTSYCSGTASARSGLLLAYLCLHVCV
jgi:hypothetical protein